MLVVAGVVVLGAIMSILDITVVSVALQTFQREFDATSAQVARLTPSAMDDLASAYADVFLVGTVLVGCVLIPALFLPRHPARTPVDPTLMTH